jgi:hypothetical protein
VGKSCLSCLKRTIQAESWSWELLPKEEFAALQAKVKEQGEIVGDLTEHGLFLMERATNAEHEAEALKEQLEMAYACIRIMQDLAVKKLHAIEEIDAHARSFIMVRPEAATTEVIERIAAQRGNKHLQSWETGEALKASEEALRVSQEARRLAEAENDRLMRALSTVEVGPLAAGDYLVERRLREERDHYRQRRDDYRALADRYCAEAVEAKRLGYRLCKLDAMKVAERIIETDGPDRYAAHGAQCCADEIGKLVLIGERSEDKS